MYKIWNNGNNVTIINNSPDCWGFENVIGETNLGILGCNLRSYDIDWYNGSLRDKDDLFEWVMTEKKINKFNFTVADLMKSYGEDSYTDCETSEDVPVDTAKEYTVREQKQLIMDMFYNNCLNSSMIYEILSEIDFDRFLIRPFYAYIHSGISISLADFRDPWDSGFAGFAWYEPCENETMEEAEKIFKEDFQTYSDYLQGLYEEYNIIEYQKDEYGKWEKTDDYWTTEKSIEDVYEGMSHKFENEVEHFKDEDYEYVRENMIIGDSEMLEFLNDML